jgi:hypothetical protein
VDQTVYLPAHFLVSRPIFYRGDQRWVRNRQFGSPAHMYVSPNGVVRISAEAEFAAGIEANYIGHLEPI